MHHTRMARYFTADYVERATLRDGTKVLLRLVCPEDKELLRKGFDRWSAESRYARFLVPKERLTDEELRYLCDVDQEHHFALGAVAETGDGHGDPVGLGIARFIVLPTHPGEPVTAEAAIAVADEAQNKGLGRLLLLRLCAAAVERGVQRFRCEVLGGNTQMNRLIGDLAPTHTSHVGSGIVSMDFEIAPVPPDASPAEEPTGAIYKLFRAAAQGLIEWTEAARRFWHR